MRYSTRCRFQALILSAVMAFHTIPAAASAEDIPEAVLTAMEDQIVADGDLAPDNSDLGLGEGTGSEGTPEEGAGSALINEVIDDPSVSADPETLPEGITGSSQEAEGQQAGSGETEPETESKSEETESETQPASEETESETESESYSETGTEYALSQPDSSDAAVILSAAAEPDENILMDAAEETETEYVFTAMADNTQPAVSYVYRDESHLKGETRTCTNYRINPNPDTSPGWYVFQGNVTYSERCSVVGDVNFILTDGCVVKYEEGLKIASGCHLKIYGQEKGTGRIEASCSKNAAIGGNKGDNGGELTINGGVIHATGGNGGAGIGAGKGEGGYFGNITINGGSVTARGGGDAAGIGGSEYGSRLATITINGGSVTAYGGDKYGAGIGGGDESTDGGSIIINGGDVHAYGGGRNDWHGLLAQGAGAAIGGGRHRTGPDEIKITGGKVYAEGSWYGAAIGGGNEGYSGNITISGGDVTALCGNKSAGIGGGRLKGIGAGKHVLITGGKVTVRIGTDSSSSKDYSGAGIGGGCGGAQGGDIIIKGGSVTAESWAGAGIGGGGGYGRSGGNVTISGGIVVASSKKGAGIGGGGYEYTFDQYKDKGDGGTVNITGGEVYVSSSAGGAGIGGGAGRDGGTVTISGGYVVSTVSPMTYDWVDQVNAKHVAGNANQDVTAAIANLLCKKLFSHPVQKSPAAIGGGYVASRSGRAGKLTVTGGTLIAKSGWNNTAAIGGATGVSASDDKISFSDQMTVLYNDDIKVSTSKLSPVPAGSRLSTLKSKSNILITVCEHLGQTYKTTANGHTAQCSYCTAPKQGEQPHQWDASGLVCKICDYKRKAELVAVLANPDQTYVYNGQEIKPEVKVTSYGVVLKKDTNYKLSYDHNIDAGRGKITVTGIAPYTGTQTLSFTIKKAPLEKLILKDQEIVYDGNSHSYPGTLTVLSNGKEVPSDQYHSSAETGCDVGDYSVVISSWNQNYTGTLTGIWSIKPKGLTAENVTISPESFTYDGTAKKPVVTVKDQIKDSTVELVVNKDYTLSYSNYVNAGKANVMVIGKRNYTGIISKEYTISQAPITEVKLAKDTLVYNGARQSVTVSSVKAGNLTVPLSDCVISGQSGVNAGTYALTVTAKDNTNFTGSATAAWTIAPKSVESLTATLSTDLFIYDNTEKCPDVTVKDGTAVLVMGEDYTLTYSNNTEIGTGTVTITGKGNYTGIKELKFSIKGEIDSAVLVDKNGFPLTNNALTYDGSEQHVSVSNVKALTKDVPPDAYEVSGDVNETSTGDYTVTIQARPESNYIGSIDLYYSILVGSANNFKVTLDPDHYTFDGMAKQPNVTVNVQGNDKPLTKDTEYTLTYLDNTDAGTAKVLVRGKEGYKGTQVAVFTIEKAALTELELENASLTYNGGVQSAGISSLKAGDLIIASNEYPSTENKNSPFLISGDEASEVGTYTVKVTAKDNSNYSGSVTASYAIGKKNITDNDISCSLSETQFIYDGSAKTPDVTVKHDNVTLEEGVDYTFKYDANVNAGTGSVTITGTGNYTGTKVLEFTIAQAKIDWAELEEDILFYEGEQQALKIISVTAGELDVPTEAYEVSGDIEVSEEGTSGYVTSKEDVGDYTVTVSAKEGGNYSGSFVIPYSIIPKDQNAFYVELSETEYVYDGTDKKPEVLVTDEGRVLTKDKEYTVEYFDNKNAGTAKVKVTGKGGYRGTRIFAYTIEKALIDAASLKKSILTYNGTQQSVTVDTIWADDLPVPADNCIIAGNTAKNAGTYQVTVSAKENSNYTGSVSVPYTIVPENVGVIEAGLSETEFTYNGQEHKPAVTVYATTAQSEDRVELKEGEDYSIAYSDNVDAGMASVLISGMGNYTGAVVLLFKIKKAPIRSVKLQEDKLIYNGETQTALVSEVMAGDEEDPKLSVPDDAYSVSGNSEKKIGSYAVMVTAKSNSNYTGSATTRYTIQPGDGFDVWVALEDIDFVYDGKEKRPALVIYDEEDLLKEGEDYTISYSDNINAGIATITVTYLKNYTGTFEYAFEIEKAPIDAIVLEQDGKLIYNGMNQTPVVQKVSSRGLTVPADDYQIQVNAQKEAGSYPLTALITNEDSNFTGSVETTWQIIPKEEKEEPKEDVRPAAPAPVQQDLFWLSSVSQKKRSIELTWTSIPNATSYVIYGNQCGKKMKKLMTVAYGNSFRVKKVGKKLKKGKYYKFQVDAVDSAGTVLATSNLIHVATKGGSVTNFRTVRIASSLLDKAASLKPGETLNLKAKGVKQNKRRKVRIHKRISYLSTNQEVASVSEKGIIQAKAPGRCLVYAYTQSGTRVGVEVVVSQEG